MTDTTITGNKIRDTFLSAAIIGLRNQGKPITLDAVAAELPPDFDLSDDEVSAMLTSLPSKSLEKIESPRENADAQPHEVMADVTPEPEMLSHDAALRAMADWQGRLHLARNALNAAMREQQIARSKIPEAVQFFLTGHKTTRESLVREFLATEAAKREARAEQGRNAARGPAMVDLVRGRGGKPGNPYGAKRRPVLDPVTGRFVTPFGVQGIINRDPARGTVKPEV